MVSFWRWRRKRKTCRKFNRTQRRANWLHLGALSPSPPPHPNPHAVKYFTKNISRVTTNTFLTCWRMIPKSLTKHKTSWRVLPCMCKIWTIKLLPNDWSYWNISWDQKRSECVRIGLRNQIGKVLKCWKIERKPWPNGNFWVVIHAVKWRLQDKWKKLAWTKGISMKTNPS